MWRPKVSSKKIMKRTYHLREEGVADKELLKKVVNGFGSKIHNVGQNSHYNYVADSVLGIEEMMAQIIPCSCPPCKKNGR